MIFKSDKLHCPNLKNAATKKLIMECALLSNVHKICLKNNFAEFLLQLINQSSHRLGQISWKKKERRKKEKSKKRNKFKHNQ